MDRLRCYIAHNAGLTTMRYANGKLETLDEAFTGRTLEHLTGPPGEPNVLFAAVAFDGAYRTRDAGATWEKILDGDVRAIAIDPHDARIVYAGVGPVRLFRSDDGGTTWEPLDGLLAVSDEVKAQWGVPGTYVGTEVPHVRYIFVHPDDGRLLFVLIEHGGVLLSRDGGLTWLDRSAGIGYLDMHVLENYPGQHRTLLRLVGARVLPHRRCRRTLGARRDRDAVDGDRALLLLARVVVPRRPQRRGAADAGVRRARLTGRVGARANDPTGAHPRERRRRRALACGRARPARGPVDAVGARASSPRPADAVLRIR